MPQVQAEAIILGDSVSHGWATDHVVVESSIVAESGVTPSPFVGVNAPLTAGSLVTASASVSRAVTSRVLGDSATFGWASSQVVVEAFVVASSSAEVNTGVQASAAIVAGSTAEAEGAIETRVSSTIIADSAYVDSAISRIDASSVMQASATIVISAVAAFVGSVIITANGLVVVDLSGHATGTAIVTPATPSVLVLMSGRDGGMATVIANIGLKLSGSTVGVATVSTPLLSFHVFLSGQTLGFSTVTDSAPLPIFGRGGGSGFLQVVTVPPPVNSVSVPNPPRQRCRHRNFDIWEARWNGTYQRRQQELEGDADPNSVGCTCPSDDCPRGGNVNRNPCQQKQFRWGYFFTFKDLPLCLSDASGNPFSPYLVTYTMYWIRNGIPMQAGPSGKRPVQQKVGLYYAVGAAGENGQPGDWLVRWCYAQTFGGTYTTVDYPFQVVDAVTKPIPGDPTCRVQKYGWD